MNAIVCSCGEVLSADGISWKRQGYRISRRSDGTIIRGIVGRPEAKGSKIMCKPCATEAVARRRAS